MPTTITRLMPAGCDQQGRHATRQWPEFPDTVPVQQPAEACTEIGAEPEFERLPRPVCFRLLLQLVVGSWLAVAALWHLVALLWHRVAALLA